MRRGAGKKHLRIRGIVIPIVWDAEANASKATIFTANEEEYLIEENTKSKQLLSLIRQEVAVRGTVAEEVGQKVITVKDCQRSRRKQDTSKILQKEDAIHHRWGFLASIAAVFQRNRRFKRIGGRGNLW